MMHLTHFSFRSKNIFTKMKLNRMKNANWSFGYDLLLNISAISFYLQSVFCFYFVSDLMQYDWLIRFTFHSARDDCELSADPEFHLIYVDLNHRLQFCHHIRHYKRQALLWLTRSLSFFCLFLFLPKPLYYTHKNSIIGLKFGCSLFDFFFMFSFLCQQVL